MFEAAEFVFTFYFIAKVISFEPDSSPYIAYDLNNKKKHRV